MGGYILSASRRGLHWRKPAKKNIYKSIQIQEVGKEKKSDRRLKVMGGGGRLNLLDSGGISVLIGIPGKKGKNLPSSNRY